MVAPRILPRTNLLLYQQPPVQLGTSTSSLTSTHSCRSIIKNPANLEASTSNHARPAPRRVHFSQNDHHHRYHCNNNNRIHLLEESSSRSFALEDISISSESSSLQDNLTVEVREYDPCIDATNAPQLFFTGEDIDFMRADARRQANRFAVDYPDFVETLEHLYDKGTTITLDDLVQVHKPLRHRRKRKHAMAIALQWSILDNNEDEDDINNDDDEEDFCFDTEDAIEDAKIAPVHHHEDYYATGQEDHAIDNEVFCHVDMRGLEVRVTTAFRLHRKRAIDSILHLQREMKRAGCAVSQIEMGLRAKAVQFSNRSNQFAVHQAQLDRLELVL